MSDDDEAVVVGQLSTVTVPRHIKKRSLRNKALSVGFNDKDLRDFVTGFHKRKKKRRKEAQRQLQEKGRIRRIQARKQRKQERESAYGGVPLEDEQGSGSGPCDLDGDCDEDAPGLNASVSGTKMYENGDTTITVTTVELSRDNDDLKTATHPVAKPDTGAGANHSLAVKKKPLKRPANNSRRKSKKPSQKKDKKKGWKKRAAMCRKD